MSNVIRSWDSSPHRPRGGGVIDPEAVYQKMRTDMEDTMRESFITMAGLVICDVHGHTPSQQYEGKKGARGVWSCAHVLENDPIHPAPVVWMPSYYYLCRKCLDLLERKKLNFGKELKYYCWGCIQDEVTRLKGINPQLFMDLNAGKTVRPFDALEDNKPG